MRAIEGGVTNKENARCYHLILPPLLQKKNEYNDRKTALIELEFVIQKFIRLFKPITIRIIIADLVRYSELETETMQISLVKMCVCVSLQHN